MSVAVPLFFAAWFVIGGGYYMLLGIHAVRAGRLENHVESVLTAMMTMFVGVIGFLLTCGPLFHRVTP